MKRLRKVLVWAPGSLVGLLLVLIALGYIFEDKLHLLAIRELGKSLNARIEVDETEVSFLKSWPKVRVELQGLRINPVNENHPYDVIAIDNAQFTIDFWSIFSDKYQISGVNLREPNFTLSVDEEGSMNIADMFQPPVDSTATPEDSSALVFAHPACPFWTSSRKACQDR